MAAVRIALIAHPLPVGLVGLDPLAELAVLEAGAWHHAHEPPTPAVDVIHGLARAQLGIGDVEEVATPGGAAQRLPALDMGG